MVAYRRRPVRRYGKIFQMSWIPLFMTWRWPRSQLLPPQVQTNGQGWRLSYNLQANVRVFIQTPLPSSLSMMQGIGTTDGRTMVRCAINVGTARVQFPTKNHHISVWTRWQQVAWKSDVVVVM